MKYIDTEKINNLLADNAKVSSQRLDVILNKAKSLQRLTLGESAALLSVKEPRDIKKIFAAASFVKDAIYGRRVVLFAPLYISNLCTNACLYCAFKSDNSLKNSCNPFILSGYLYICSINYYRLLLLLFY